MGQSAGEEGRFCAAAPCGNSPGISSRPGKPEKFYPHDLFLCFQHYPVSRIYGDNRFHALCGEALKSSGTGYFNCKSGQYLFSSGVPCRKNRGASGCEACLWETVCLWCSHWNRCGAGVCLFDILWEAPVRMGAGQLNRGIPSGYRRGRRRSCRLPARRSERCSGECGRP